MKYKVGTPTILGKIYTLRTGNEVLFPYRIRNSVTGGCRWFAESEIDAIVIKPKRNIDHLIELIEARKKEEAVSFIDNCQQSTSWLFWLHMLDEYAAPRKYPVLTPEELKAVKWLVEGGFTRLKRINGIWEMAESEEAYLYLTSFMPTAKCLRDVAWLTETPINLKELLEAQEDV